MADEDYADDATDATGEGSYLLLVGGLLLIIGMALGWLWLTERSRRIDAERRAVQVQRELDRTKAQLDAMKGLPPRFALPRTSRPASRPHN